MKHINIIARLIVTIAFLGMIGITAYMTAINEYGIAIVFFLVDMAVLWFIDLMWRKHDDNS